MRSYRAIRHKTSRRGLGIKSRLYNYTYNYIAPFSRFYVTSRKADSSNIEGARKNDKLSRPNERTVLRHLHAKRIIPSRHFIIAQRKVLMNPETRISLHETGNTELRQCKRMHKRSRRRSERISRNNNRLRRRPFVFANSYEERNTSRWTTQIIRIAASIGLLGML